MRERFREQLQKEMTRGQFLQVLAGLLLAIFGFHNLLAFFGADKPAGSGSNNAASDQRFGTRKFGR